MLKINKVLIYSIVAVIGVFVCAYLIYARQYNRNRTISNIAGTRVKPVSDDSSSKTVKKTVDSATKTPGVTMHSEASNPINITAPDIYNLLSELKDSYKPGGWAARVRLQETIRRKWEEEPPNPKELIDQIIINGEPDEYRIFLARVFRNFVKRGVFNKEDISLVMDKFYAIIEDKQDSALVRSEIAMTIAEFDKSDKLVNIIRPLLYDVESDEAATRAVSAIRIIGSQKAADALYEFVERYREIQNVKPAALISALFALTGEGKKNLVPILKHLAMETPSFTVFQGAMQCLIKTSSSTVAVEAILDALDSTKRFEDKIQREAAERICVTALINHRIFIENSLNKVENTEKGILEKAIRVIKESEKK